MCRLRIDINVTKLCSYYAVIQYGQNEIQVFYVHSLPPHSGFIFVWKFAYESQPLN